MDIKPRHLAARVFHLREGDIVEIVFIQTCLLRAATGVKPEVLRRYLGLGARRKGSQGTKGDHFCSFRACGARSELDRLLDPSEVARPQDAVS